MGIKYTKIDDKNYIKTSTEEVNITKLEENIANLQKQLDDIPTLKTEPDIECMEFYNMHIDMINNKDGIENELQKEKEKLNNIIKIKK